MKHDVSPGGTVRLAVCLTVAVATVSFVSSADGAKLVGRWKLNEPGPAYADAGLNGVALIQDATTTTAISDAGIEGACARLNWQPSPGVGTRLAATNSALQTDSFGFSFWLNPVFINDWDNLIAKEMAYDAIAPSWAKQAWQLHFLGDGNANGKVALELVVRGAYRTNSDHTAFYGAVTSADSFAKGTSYTNWIHIAGGYDAVTGALSLYVDGIAYSASGTPGGDNSDGGSFAIGSVRNGSDFVAFSAGADVEDVQLYDGPLSAADVSFLKANPSGVIRTFSITGFSTTPNGDVFASLSTVPGANYTLEGAANMGGFSAVTNFTAVFDYTSLTVPKGALDAVLGSAPREKLFLRAQERATPTGFELCH